MEQNSLDRVKIKVPRLQSLCEEVLIRDTIPAYILQVCNLDAYKKIDFIDEKVKAALEEFILSIPMHNLVNMLQLGAIDITREPKKLPSQDIFALSCTHNFLASKFYEGNIRVANLITEKNYEVSNNKEFCLCAFSPDEKMLVFSAWAGSHDVYVYDIKSHSESYLAKTRAVKQFLFLDNNTLLIKTLGTLQIYDFIKQEQRSLATSFANSKDIINLPKINCIAFKIRFTREIIIMDLNAMDQRSIWTEKGDLSAAYSDILATTSDNTLLAFSYRLLVEIWNIAQKKAFMTRTINFEKIAKGEISACCFNPTNNHEILVGTNFKDYSIYLCNTRSNSLLKKYKHCLESPITKLSWSNNASSIIFQDGMGSCYQWIIDPITREIFSYIIKTVEAEPKKT